MSSPVQSSAARESKGSLPSRHPRTATLVAVLGLFVVSLGLLYATALALSAWNPGAVVLSGSAWLLSVLLLALLSRPYFQRLTARTRPVPEGLHEETRAVCTRNGVPVRRAWLTPEMPGERFAAIVGSPWDRHLLADEWFFASLSPEEREALLARETALARNRYRLFRHVAGPGVLAVAGAFLAVASLLRVELFGASEPLLVGIASAGLYSLAAKHGTEKVYAADRYAARRTSPEAVAGLLEKEASQREGSAWRRWPVSMLAMTPTIDRRIERVGRGGAASDG